MAALWDSMRLAQHLGDRPVYGLQTIATEESVDVSVEAMAARCVREIREKVPNGPYHLGGFCAAAKTAIEVAQQLRAEGQEVGLVAVFDYGMDEPPLPRSIVGAAVDFLRNLPLWIAYDLIPVGPRRIAGRLRSRFRLAWHAVERRLGLRQTAAEPDIRDALGMWMYTAEQAKTLSILWSAFEQYTLRPYAGRRGAVPATRRAAGSAATPARSRLGADRQRGRRGDHRAGLSRDDARREVRQRSGSQAGARYSIALTRRPSIRRWLRRNRKL